MSAHTHLLALLKVWLASNRSSLYALAAAVLVAFLLRRPPPQNAGVNEGAAQGKATKSRPRITLSTTQSVFFAQGAPTFELAAGALDALRKLAAHADVYLITSHIASDGEEAALRAALERAGVADLPGFDARKILVCRTAMGRSAMCRQIEPSLHIDAAAEVAEALAPHLPHVALVSHQPAVRARENMLFASSLGELVDLYLESVRCP